MQKNKRTNSNKEADRLIDEVFEGWARRTSLEAARKRFDSRLQADECAQSLDGSSGKVIAYTPQPGEAARNEKGLGVGYVRARRAGNR